MRELPGPRSAYADDVLRVTVGRMVELFGISESEAQGRVASAFGSWDLDCVETDRWLGHEDEDYWAHWVFYGPVTWWCLPPEELVPRPWP